MGDLSNLVSLDPLEPLEVARVILMIDNGQVLYQAPWPSDANNGPEWQRLCDGMRHAQYAFDNETAEARARNANPNGQPPSTT